MLIFRAWAMCGVRYVYANLYVNLREGVNLYQNAHTLHANYFMKNVLFPKIITIFKLIYLFWFKMKQTLPAFCVTCFTSVFASASFSARFPGVGLLGWDDFFIL